jgi:2-methylcitrate dehydratase PrpD
MATIVDTIGCAAASAPEAFADAALRMARSTWGDGPCSVVGRPERLTPAGAAMMNATLAHGYDYDDVHMPSIAHFSTITVPVAMAAAEMCGADGPTFLVAVAAGDEVGGRIGWSVCDSRKGGSGVRSRGFFPTAALGTLAAAVTAARCFRLDSEGIAQSIAIAGSHAAGLAAISRGDNSTKRVQAGWAAQAGLAAAVLAREGFTGPEAVLETPQGFYEAFAGGEYDPARLQPAPGSPYICEEMSFKWYPLEYMIHPLVELASQAKRVIDGELGSITCIEASTPARFATLFHPKETKAAPADRFMALISAPYCIARALLKGGDGHLMLTDFREDYVFDEQHVQLASKVAFTPDQSLDDVFPLHVGGKLRVLSGDCVLWEGALRDVYGSPERPLRPEHLLSKFESNCSVLGADRAEDIMRTLNDLPHTLDAGWVSKLTLGINQP